MNERDTLVDLEEFVSDTDYRYFDQAHAAFEHSIWKDERKRKLAYLIAGIFFVSAVLSWVVLSNRASWSGNYGSTPLLVIQPAGNQVFLQSNVSEVFNFTVYNQASNPITFNLSMFFSTQFIRMDWFNASLKLFVNNLWADVPFVSVVKYGVNATANLTAGPMGITPGEQQRFNLFLRIDGPTIVFVNGLHHLNVQCIKPW